MSLPSSTVKHLDLLGLQINSEPLNQRSMFDCVPLNQLAIGVILEDSIGKIQCIVPADCFIDLRRLNEQYGRDFRATTIAATCRIANSFGLASLPSLPHFAGLECVYASQLPKAEQLYFHPGSDDELVRVPRADFETLLKDSTCVDFAQPVINFQPPSDVAPPSDERNIVAAVENFTSLRIKQRLEATLEIPPMPSTSQRVIRLRVDPNAGVADLATLVETDPSLAAQVVSWAGSPLYGAPGKVRSVHDAVIRVLGFDLVINLALGLSIGKSLSMPADRADGTLSYWQEAVYSAAITEAIAKLIPKPIRPQAGLCYLIGLLHNFGYLILGHVFPPHLALINRYVEANPHVEVQVIEQFLLGLTRQQLCAWLLNSWQMPAELVTAIRWQGDLSYQGEHHIYSHLSVIVSKLLANRVNQQPLLNLEQSLKILQLEYDRIPPAMDAIWDNLSHLDAMATDLART